MSRTAFFPLFVLLAGCAFDASTPVAQQTLHADAAPDEEVRLGALDKSLIDDVIRTGLDSIRSCYQQGLNAVGPSLSGRVVVKFVIAPDGSIASADLAEDSLQDEPVTDCILDRIEELEFPEPEGGGVVVVRYPFDFSSGD